MNRSGLMNKLSAYSALSASSPRLSGIRGLQVCEICPLCLSSKPSSRLSVETGLFANYRQTLPMSSGAVYNYNVREGCVLVYCVFVLQKDVRCLLELSIVMNIIGVAYYCCCCCYYYYCCSPSYGPSKQ